MSSEENIPDTDVNKIIIKIEKIDKEPNGLCPKNFLFLFLI